MILQLDRHMTSTGLMKAYHAGDDAIWIWISAPRARLAFQRTKAFAFHSVPFYLQYMEKMKAALLSPISAFPSVVAAKMPNSVCNASIARLASYATCNYRPSDRPSVHAHLCCYV